MTAREKLIQAMARAICAANGFDPDVDVHADRQRREALKASADYCPEWKLYVYDAAAALTAIAEQGYAVVPRISDCDPAAIYQNYLSQNDVARS